MDKHGNCPDFIHGFVAPDDTHAADCGQPLAHESFTSAGRMGCVTCGTDKRRSGIMSRAGCGWRVRVCIWWGVEWDNFLSNVNSLTAVPSWSG